MKPKSSKESRSKRPINTRSFYFRSVDLFGGTLDFKFNTLTGKFQTIFGSLLTVLTCILAVLLFTFLYSQHRDTSDPVVTKSSTKSSKPVKINLFKDSMITPVSLAIRASEVKAEDLDKYLTIKGFIVERKFSKSTNMFEYTSIQEFGYKPCSQYTNPETYKDYLEDSKKLGSYKFVLCPDLEETPELAEVVSNPSGLDSKTLFIRVYPCSLPDQSQCSSSNGYNFMVLTFAFTSWVMRSENYTDPLGFRPFYRGVALDPASQKYYLFETRRHQIVDSLSEFRGEMMK